MYWIHQASRKKTRKNRIIEIIRLCYHTIKTIGTRSLITVHS
ncbi:hypothetical protein [Polaribacter sp. Q13]|nr:hypothetical protein [Polaribacter sp. Q13]